MIIAWLIGFILCLIALLLLKNSRDYSWDRGGEPVLKVWSLIIILLISLFPILNIIISLVVLFSWIISICNDDIELKVGKRTYKILQLLNKPIK